MRSLCSSCGGRSAAGSRDYAGLPELRVMASQFWILALPRPRTFSTGDRAEPPGCRWDIGHWGAVLCFQSNTSYHYASSPSMHRSPQCISHDSAKEFHFQRQHFHPITRGTASLPFPVSCQFILSLAENGSSPCITPKRCTESKFSKNKISI